MAFGFKAFQILEIVNAQKCLRDGSSGEHEADGNSITLDTMVVPLDNPHIVLRFRASAGRSDKPTSYKAVLVLDDQRIRGVDFFEMEVRRRFRVHIPLGWHQNVVDPNLPASDPDQNRHIAILDFNPSDFADFVRKVCGLWNIELKTPEEIE